MSLANRLNKKVAMIGLAGSLLFSGCTSINESIAYNQAIWAKEKAEREARLASGQQGGIAQIWHDAGNPIEGAINTGVYVLGGNAGGTRQPVQSQQVYGPANPVKDRLTAHDFNDNNRNGIIDSVQEVGRINPNPSIEQGIVVELTNFNSSRQVRLAFSNKGKIEYQTDFFDQPSGKNLYLAFDSLTKYVSSSGDCNITAYDNSGNLIGTTVLNVKSQNNQSSQERL